MPRRDAGSLTGLGFALGLTRSDVAIPGPMIVSALLKSGYQNGFAIPIGPHAAGALRLLLFTGCRLREILHLKWEHVDFERGLLFLPESKTGKKTVVLNARPLPC